jgi:hypothetical protein
MLLGAPCNMPMTQVLDSVSDLRCNLYVFLLHTVPKADSRGGILQWICLAFRRLLVSLLPALTAVGSRHASCALWSLETFFDRVCYLLPCVTLLCPGTAGRCLRVRRVKNAPIGTRDEVHFKQKGDGKCLRVIG